MRSPLQAQILAPVGPIPYDLLEIPKPIDLSEALFFFREDIIPGGTYEGVPSDVVTVSIPNLLLANGQTSDKLVRAILEVIFSSTAVLASAYYPAGSIRLSKESVSGPQKLHLAAEAFYKDNNIIW
jgi:TRAP-type uncharacterized transport system substrate-binding protein